MTSRSDGLDLWFTQPYIEKRIPLGLSMLKCLLRCTVQYNATSSASYKSTLIFKTQQVYSRLTPKNLLLACAIPVPKACSYHIAKTVFRSGAL